YSIEKEINWLNGGAAVSIVPMIVTANFFDVTGATVAVGGAFSAVDARAEDQPHLVVVSYEFWHRELAADTSAVGRALVLNGEPYTVVGVLAPRVMSIAGFAIAPSVYVPLSRTILPDMLAPGATIVQ